MATTADEQPGKTEESATPLTLAEATAVLTASGQPFEIEEITIRGVPTRTWKSAPATLRTVLELSKLHGDSDFLVYEDERLTFDEHFAQVASLAHQLVGRFGIRKGDRVAIAMRNLPEWIMAFWAAIAVGAIVVPLNAWWTAPELAYGLRDSGTTLVVTDEERRQRILSHLDDAGALSAMIVTSEEPGEDGRRRHAGRRISRAAGSGTPRRSCPSPMRSARSTRRRRSPTSPSTLTTTPRSSTPRAPPGGPRVRSAPTATASPT